MFNLGPMELVIILIIVLIFFGSTRLPGLAKSLGQSVKSFKKGIESGGEEEDESPKQLEGVQSQAKSQYESAKETEKQES